MLKKLISGGQTGADRAALDMAIRHNFPHGGWCPKGRKAEDGVIGGQYQLTETPRERYLERTEWNVRDSDGTVVFTFAKEPQGGSARTMEFAAQLGKPLLHINLEISPPTLNKWLNNFVQGNRIEVLNVAGSRESTEPGIYAFVSRSLEDTFFWGTNHPGMIGGPGEG